MARIRSTIERVATKSTMSVACGRRTRVIDESRIGQQVVAEPALSFNADPHDPGSAHVDVRNLDSDLIASFDGWEKAGSLLKSIFRVRVLGAAGAGGEEDPDVYGRYQILQNRLRFMPYFPFEPGVRFRATFDPRPLGRPELSDMLALEFSVPKERSAARARVTQVFPSSAELPENLLRFYVRFSRPMQRGRAEEQIRLLSSDGQPAADVLYRPPVELWDASMRYLTILLDPGRLKRGVGPNRELGPPLKAGLGYMLVIGSGMIDASGQSLGKSFCKGFRAAAPA